MNRKTFTFFSLGLMLTGCAFAQKVQDLPEYSVSQSQTTRHMNILAADEMLGRKPGEPGNLMAGRYIAEQFRALGLKPANGTRNTHTGNNHLSFDIYIFVIVISFLLVYPRVG